MQRDSLQYTGIKNYFGGFCFMKKCFKKIFGAMSVCSILTGSVGIGASAYKFNAVPVGSVPGMTEEKVKIMNAMAEKFLMFNEMVRTDSSQWVKFSGRLKELVKFIKNIKASYAERVWKENFSKNSEWTNADHARFEAKRIIESNEVLFLKLFGFFIEFGI